MDIDIKICSTFFFNFFLTFPGLQITLLQIGFPIQDFQDYGNLGSSKNCFRGGELQ